MFQPRPKQAEVLAYNGGRMGVSAVPGSGKTATLAYLGARLVATTDLERDQEILIVTLVRSAVGNFAQSIARYLRDEFKLLPGLSYRVCTLHSLANDIVRERPALVNLADDYTVLDDFATSDILQEAVESWVRANPIGPDAYLGDQYFADARIRSVQWPDTVRSMAQNFIQTAKDMQLSADEVRARLKSSPDALPLAHICVDIYEQYERSLRYRGAVDFQDLIRLALRILNLDPQYLARMRARWPIILEDEAQDSSLLQEQILRKLADENGNWVRVGDPNQAIYETFTTANPRYLRDFLEEDGVTARTLPNSGRSTESIIRLANQLIRWTMEHPNPAIREKEPLAPPFIEPTPPGDPQGNPPDNPEMIHLRGEAYTPDQEREAVIRSLQQWLPANQDKTCAVLIPINKSGTEFVKWLRRAGLDFVENLRSTSSTRAVVGALSFILEYLQDPKDANHLAQAYRVWRRDERGDDEAERSIDNIVKELRKINRVEDYIWPRLTDWLSASAGDNEALSTHLDSFRTVVRRWQGAADLPIDQLILTISGDLFQLDTEIATAYSVALYLRRFVEIHPEARLPEYIAELSAIISGQRTFMGISDDDDNFDPDQHRGKVTVTTMHKAKGLEWDRVYLMSANNYDYPSADPFDSFIGERYFVRNQLNLDAEALAQLESLAHNTPYVEGSATEDARIEYAAERLRLLYVGITRARRELIITWNTGRRGEQVEARPVAALRGWWEREQERNR